MRPLASENTRPQAPGSTPFAQLTLAVQYFAPKRASLSHMVVYFHVTCYRYSRMADINGLRNNLDMYRSSPTLPPCFALGILCFLFSDCKFDACAYPHRLMAVQNADIITLHLFAIVYTFPSRLSIVNPLCRLQQPAKPPRGVYVQSWL